MGDQRTAVPWHRFEGAEPSLAALVLDVLTGHPHHVVATVAPDGSPRVSGTNLYVTSGRLWMGMMPGARRADDLRRDPRCAVHSAPLDEHLQRPDVRLDLVARECSSEDFRSLLVAVGHPDASTAGTGFELELRRVTVVTVADEQLVLDVWTPSGGRRRSTAG